MLTKKRTGINAQCACVTGSVNLCKWNKNEHISECACNVLIYCCHYRYLAQIQKASCIFFRIFIGTLTFTAPKTSLRGTCEFRFSHYN